jgi:hypothetical protein
VPYAPYQPTSSANPLTEPPQRVRVAARVPIRQTSTTDLAYRFEEDVFVPGEPASLNLASMLAAQAALNYGLFAREIVFRGPFDEADRGFLADMAEGTAREIYVSRRATRSASPGRIWRSRCGSSPRRIFPRISRTKSVRLIRIRFPSLSPETTGLGLPGTDVIEKILRHSALWNPPWKRERRARGPPLQGDFFSEESYSQLATQTEDDFSQLSRGGDDDM